jgi:hypothetical protein
VSMRDSVKRVSHYLYEMSVIGFPQLSSRPYFYNVASNARIPFKFISGRFSHLTEVYHDAVNISESFKQCDSETNTIIS